MIRREIKLYIKYFFSEYNTNICSIQAVQVYKNRFTDHFLLYFQTYIQKGHLIMRWAFLQHGFAFLSYEILAKPSNGVYFTT
mgnify:CR=1 FL=1